MEAFRAFPRQLVFAAGGLLIALTVVELVGTGLRYLGAGAAKFFPLGMFEAVLLLSPLLLLFYAAPGLLALRTMGKSAWILAPVLGAVPGYAMGASAGIPVYGALLGFIAGLLSLVLQRLYGVVSKQSQLHNGRSAA